MFAHARQAVEPDQYEAHARLEEAFAACTRALVDLVTRAADNPEILPLTPREREIAGLIAHGLSNPEVARRLIVSERTVDTHVQNLLRKLNVRSRSHVAAVLDTQFSQPAPRRDTPPPTYSRR